MTLKDQLATTSSNCERQLSIFSDHLCELNGKLLKESDEMEILCKSTVSTKELYISPFTPPYIFV